MPEVRYTADGGTYRVGGHGFDPGDVRDVDDELADYLADHEDFVVVDDADGDEAANFEFTFPDGRQVSDLTVDELTDRLDDLPADALEDVRRAESGGEDRNTALEAIDSQLNERED